MEAIKPKSILMNARTSIKNDNKAKFPRLYQISRQQHNLIQQVGCFSDHYPILLRSSIIDWGPKPLKVMDWWLKDKGFQNMVAHSWGNYHPNGWGGYVLKQKLKFLKHCIRQWSSQNGSVTARKINDLKKQINDMEAGLDQTYLREVAKEKKHRLLTMLKCDKHDARP
ncbi:hypothetical protein GmHk_18G051814 [Glycine max]|nr:hypothetical protein GmHk_18G051814 [Glycine max]